MDKQKKIQAANLLVEYKDELQAELDSINKTIQVIMGVEASQSPKNQSILGDMSTAGALDWTQLSFQETVLMCLQIRPNKALRASEIARFLKKKRVRGHDRKSFSSMVATTVRRLAGLNKVLKTSVTVKNRSVAAFQFKKEGYLL